MNRQPEGRLQQDQRPAGRVAAPATVVWTRLLSLVVVLLILTGLPLAGG